MTQRFFAPDQPPLLSDTRRQDFLYQCPIGSHGLIDRAPQPPLLHALRERVHGNDPVGGQRILVFFPRFPFDIGHVQPAPARPGCFAVRDYFLPAQLLKLLLQEPLVKENQECDAAAVVNRDFGQCHPRPGRDILHPDHFAADRDRFPMPDIADLLEVRAILIAARVMREHVPHGPQAEGFAQGCGETLRHPRNGRQGIIQRQGFGRGVLYFFTTDSLCRHRLPLHFVPTRRFLSLYGVLCPNVKPRGRLTALPVHGVPTDTVSVHGQIGIGQSAWRVLPCVAFTCSILPAGS